jgi:hypothetical protein
VGDRAHQGQLTLVLQFEPLPVLQLEAAQHSCVVPLSSVQASRH